MSTPDAKLSAAERAALASLEAAAVADDPHLAARLRGSPASRLKAAAPIVLSYLQGRWATVLKLRWWGIPISVVGLVLMILGLSVGLVLAVFGAVVCAAGLRIAAQMVANRTPAERRSKPAPPP